MSDTLDIQSALDSIERLEGESHRLWDEAFGDVAFSYQSTEESRERMRQSARERTYRATALHAQAMETLRRLQSEVASADTQARRVG
jgi:hypothetical protein